MARDKAPTHRSRKRSCHLLLERSRKAGAPWLENGHREHRNRFRYLIAEQRSIGVRRPFDANQGWSGVGQGAHSPLTKAQLPPPARTLAESCSPAARKRPPRTPKPFPIIPWGGSFPVALPLAAGARLRRAVRTRPLPRRWRLGLCRSIHQRHSYARSRTRPRKVVG